MQRNRRRKSHAWVPLSAPRILIFGFKANFYQLCRVEINDQLEEFHHPIRILGESNFEKPHPVYPLCILPPKIGILNKNLAIF
jgi:hypothetical protein